MPTHAVKFINYADEIIILKNGRVAAKGVF